MTAVDAERSKLQVQFSWRIVCRYQFVWTAHRETEQPMSAVLERKQRVPDLMEHGVYFVRRWIQTTTWRVTSGRCSSTQPPRHSTTTRAARSLIPTSRSGSSWKESQSSTTTYLFCLVFCSPSWLWWSSGCRLSLRQRFFSVKSRFYPWHTLHPETAAP